LSKFGPGFAIEVDDPVEGAETCGFNITLERDLDPEAGEVDVFPQEITRVLGLGLSLGRRIEAVGNQVEQ
jgi:hypothetical protein